MSRHRARQQGGANSGAQARAENVLRGRQVTYRIHQNYLAQLFNFFRNFHVQLSYKLLYKIIFFKHNQLLVGDNSILKR